LAKFWKTRFEWPGGRVSSYFMELLSIHLCDVYDISSERAFVRRLLYALATIDELNVDMGHFGGLIPPDVRK
jgi:hypothetical protein